MYVQDTPPDSSVALGLPDSWMTVGPSAPAWARKGQTQAMEL